MIMFIRRSNRSATAPASGPSSSAGSSAVSQTALTAAPCAAIPRLVRIAASAVSASRLSQSPRLDSDVAIHRRLNGLMDSTLTLAAELGSRWVTALGYRSLSLRAAYLDRNVHLYRSSRPSRGWRTISGVGGRSTGRGGGWAAPGGGSGAAHPPPRPVDRPPTPLIVRQPRD